ncbi:16S rRNA (cytidine(1402)-2'-O)-methyltransferase [bacterium]|nr:16S rRNA (cytidine(1402)-2'-O)-methyltransferase [bacterium]
MNKGQLYIIGTPIGNLEDITIRAIKTLRKVEIVFAEDTRKARILLSRYRIKTRLESLHSYNEKSRLGMVLKYMDEGLSVGLISESGMPAISDPGAIVIREAIRQGYDTVVVPGPTAFITALIKSGFQMDDFLFLGFPPASPKKRRRFLRNLKESPYTVILYESPHRLIKFLNEAIEILGDRELAVARELTKLFEEIIIGKVSQVLQHFSQNPIKGEFVIIVSPLKNI